MPLATRNARVASRERRRGRRHDLRRLGLRVFADALVRHEVVPAIARQRAAGVAAEHRQPIRRLGDLTVRIRALRIERVVADREKDAAARGVRPRTRQDVDDAARGAPVLGLVVVGEHLEFLDRVERDAHALKAADVAGVVHAVERELIRALPRSGEGIAEGLRRRRQPQQRQVIAAEERQQIELLAVDPHLDRRGRRLDDRHVGGDDEALAEAADGKLDVDDWLGAEQQDQPVADDGSESLAVGGQRIASRRERGDAIAAVGVGRRRAARSRYQC